MPELASLAVTAHPAAKPVLQAAQDESGFGFADLLDLVNPLQHIPVVSTLYRHLTGDKIGTAAKLAGDTLYGGPVGFLCSLGDTLFEGLTGKDVGDTVYAFLAGDDGKSEATGYASAPVSVHPAEGIHVTMPDLSFLSETAADVPQRAAAAYGKAAMRSYEAV
jgi:hypothetical protein